MPAKHRSARWSAPNCVLCWCVFVFVGRPAAVLFAHTFIWCVGVDANRETNAKLRTHFMILWHLNCSGSVWERMFWCWCSAATPGPCSRSLSIPSFSLSVCVHMPFFVLFNPIAFLCGISHPTSSTRPSPACFVSMGHSRHTSTSIWLRQAVRQLLFCCMYLPNTGPGACVFRRLLFFLVCTSLRVGPGVGKAFQHEPQINHSQRASDFRLCLAVMFSSMARHNAATIFLETAAFTLDLGRWDMAKWQRPKNQHKSACKFEFLFYTKLIITAILWQLQMRRFWIYFRQFLILFVSFAFFARSHSSAHPFRCVCFGLGRMVWAVFVMVHCLLRTHIRIRARDATIVLSIYSFSIPFLLLFYL